MCRRVAVASVLFVGQSDDLLVCRECFDREALERPGDWLEFENLVQINRREIRERRSQDRKTRALAERSSQELEDRRPVSRAEWLERRTAGLDPTAPREIGELLRQEWRELYIPGAAAPGADSGPSGPDQSAPHSRRAHRNSP